MEIHQLAPITLCLTKPVLAAGATTTINTTGTATYLINSKFYTRTALSNGATPTTDYATGLAFVPVPIPLSSPNIGGVVNGAAGYGSVYAVGFDSGGTMRVIQGSITALDGSGAFITAPVFGGAGPLGSGSTSTDWCMFGYIIIKLGATAVATWTFGTNNLSSVTGVTYTFVDAAAYPQRPQIA